jgi:hypothetical protein
MSVGVDFLDAGCCGHLWISSLNLILEARLERVTRHNYQAGH